MNLQAWFTEWADQCKAHKFDQVEPNLRKAAGAFKRVAGLEAELRVIKVAAGSSIHPTPTSDASVKRLTGDVETLNHG